MRKKRRIGLLLLMLVFLIMPVQAQAAGKVRALVISGEDNVLAGHKRTAERFAEALKDNKLPDYETKEANIHTFFYNGKSKASGKGTTEKEFLAAINSAFKNSTSKDLNIFYYSGHGGTVGDGEHQILLNKDKSLRFKKLAKELVKYKGKYIVIFNSCHDGAFVTEGYSSLSSDNRKRITCFTSASENVSSWVNYVPEKMLEGIGFDENYENLKADENHDGMLTVIELSKYIELFGYIKNGDQVLFHFETIELEKESTTLYDGEGYRTETLEYHKENSDSAIDQSKNYVKWITSNKSIATVDQNGKVTAKEPGKVTITARYYGPKGRYYNAEDKCTVIIKKPKIKISAVNSDVLYKGGTKALKAECTGTNAPITWSSSDKSIATVSSTGVVTGKNVGKVTITAKNKDAKATYVVTVRKPTITLSDSKITLKEGKTKKLVATVKGPSQKVEWSSSNPSVATVDQNGKVTAVKGGKATITAKANGVKATCAVTVVADYRDLYYEFLCKAENSYSYKQGKATRTDVARSYYLLHLNSDDIPELIVTNMKPDVPGPTNFVVFTIKDSKVTYCGAFGDKNGCVLHYNSKQKALHVNHWINGVGGTGDTLWKVSNAKLKESKYAVTYMNGSKRIYKTGTSSGSAKKVTKSKYNTYMKNYFKGIKTHYLNYNNETNRLKSFK